MKRLLLSAVALLMVQATLCAQNPYAYFSHVCPSGQTLYYSLDANGRGASVTWPNFSDGDYWSGYEKPTGHVVIPDTVSWTYEEAGVGMVTHYYPVYGVLQNCFNGCTGITTVVFPETVTAFEPNAFAGCTSLDSIFMPQVPPELFAGQPIGMSENAAFYIPCGTWQDYFDAHYNTIHTGSAHPPCLEPEAEGVSLTLLSDNEEMGSAEFYTPGVVDYVRCDSVAMIYANPQYHYEFDHWSNGSTKVQDTLFITTDSVLTAYFTIGHHTIQVESRDEEKGTVEGGGSFLYLDTVEIRAVPRAGYHFDCWHDGNTDNPRTVLVDRDYYFMAYFAEGGVGIGDVDAGGVRVYADGQRIVVEGSEGMPVSLYDAAGRLIVTQGATGAEQLRFAVPSSGAYMVRVGDLPARRVVVIW